MDPTPVQADLIQEAFSDFLKNKKLRNTAERNAICSTVCNMNKLFTLEMIWQLLEDAKFHVSRASVFNTMELLIDANIVIRHKFKGAIVQYELKNFDDQSIYAVCTQCDTVRKVKNEKFTHLFADYKIPKFTIEHHSLHFYGMCSKCKFKLSQKKITNKNS